MSALFDSIQARHQLLESLKQRIELSPDEPKQQLVEYRDELVKQQINDIGVYQFILQPTSERSQDNSVETKMPEPSSSNQDDWKKTFADAFIKFLESEYNELHQIWLGEKYRYPEYIGFDIRRLNDAYDFNANNACWLTVYFKDDKEIHVGLAIKDRSRFQTLEFDKKRINPILIEKLKLKNEDEITWNANNSISRIYIVIGKYNDQDQEVLFYDLQKALECLDDVFHPRLEEIL